MRLARALALAGSFVAIDMRSVRTVSDHQALDFVGAQQDCYRLIAIPTPCAGGTNPTTPCGPGPVIQFASDVTSPGLFYPELISVEAERCHDGVHGGICPDDFYQEVCGGTPEI